MVFYTCQKLYISINSCGVNEITICLHYMYQNTYSNYVILQNKVRNTYQYGYLFLYLYKSFNSVKIKLVYK